MKCLLLLGILLAVGLNVAYGVDIGGACTDNANCTIVNSICMSDVCECISGFTSSDNQCVADTDSSAGNLQFNPYYILVLAAVWFSCR